jgi:hypothetical protein
MKRTVWIEGIFLLVISFVTIAEGLKLSIYKDADTLFDPVGPGFYVLILGTLLLVVAFFHLKVNYKKNIDMARVPIAIELRKKKMLVLATLAGYILLIYFVGYLFASIAFFLMMFRMSGIKSWLTIILFALLFTAFFYIFFIHYGRVMFPRPYFPFPKMFGIL